MAHDKRHKHHDEDNSDMIAKSLKAEERENQRSTTRNLNKLWIWLGVLVLVALLLWWIFSIGFVEDTTGVTNFGT